jgi:poly(hydroxyalkanoate) depolymerase family esterase
LPIAVADALCCTATTVKGQRVNIHSITDTINRALKSAGLNPRLPALRDVTATIDKALAAAGLAQPQPSAPASAPAPRPVDDLAANESAVGEFVARSFANAAGQRNYKLYVPAMPTDEPLPLIVMLHGCKQDPDDFAAGTRMNELAQRHGFLVAYPEQPRAANGSSCWNWFQASDQGRDGGEPSILAGIVGDVAARHPVDAHRVFVAGLSAGAAMAVVLGVTHADVFAAVGAHSGLPYGSAHDVASAFAAMAGAAAPSPQQLEHSAGVATIVFHGDKDVTVNAANGHRIVDQAVSAASGPGPLERVSLPSNGATRTVYRDGDGRAHVEHWLVHGGAHAWSGGSAKGSFASPHGPDASAEMVRFFLER